MCAEDSKKPADCLHGLVLENGWAVDSIIQKKDYCTGGHFSVGYHVHDSNGNKAFLKALDFSKAFKSQDVPRALESMTAAYNFERDLLYKCKSRKLSRVVVPITDGTISVPGDFGLERNVPYIIFQLANGDIRIQRESWKSFDLAWSLRSLHHTAIGLHQLHLIGIAHQDLKPSNVLFFEDDGSKIADLGNASSIDRRSPFDTIDIPGDMNYAPPEQWYNWRNTYDIKDRYISDLFLLGNLLFFFFLKCSAIQAIQYELSVIHNKNFIPSLNFNDDLPYLQAAFSKAIMKLEKETLLAANNLTDEIILIAKQLCEPDPRRRGNPKLFDTKMPHYDLQSFISAFDRLSHKAEVMM